MKYTVVLLLALLGVAAANFYREDEYGDETRKYMLIPDEEGKLHFVDLEYDPPENFFNPERDVVINLFTRRNPTSGQTIRLNDMIALRNSNFNPNHPTRFIIHGWNNKGESSVNINIRNAYHSQGEFNVFVVDWSAGSNTLYYPTAKRRVATVGPFIGRFIDFVVDTTGISTSSIHMTGHSLGAHVCGVAGRAVSRGRIHTITGMDPALPLFSLNRPDERIDRRSAEYVEILHTNGGLLGFSSPLGHGDFYPNGGRSQPGCILDVSGACAHARAHQFFAEAITSAAGFWSWNCRDYNELMRGTCTVINRMQPMGVQNGITSNHGRADGIFYLRTNSRSPFAQGRPAGWDSIDKVSVETLQKV